MPETPLPPASTWDKFPEIAIIILVALVILGAIIYAIVQIMKWQTDWQETRETSWRDWMESQELVRQTTNEKRDQMLKDFWASQNTAILVSVRGLSQIVQEVASRMEQHDQFTRDAVTSMKARTGAKTTRVRKQ